MNSKGNRIRNWSQYNKALIQRGSLTVWLPPEAEGQWYHQGGQKPGGRKLYADEAISICLLIKEVYSQGYRQTQGLVDSLLSLMKIKARSPSYSQICRRAKSMTIRLSKQARSSQKLCALVDSTGIKVYGESEWYGKKHYRKQRQRWRKVHVLVDHATQTIISAKTTEAYVHDSNHLADLLKPLAAEKDLVEVIGDGCYSLNQCHELMERYQSRLIAPPHRNSRRQDENPRFKFKAPTPQRDQAIDFVRSYLSHEEGLKEWKIVTNYHRRSLVETAMFRLKSIFGDFVRAKSLQAQHQIMQIRCLALNKMTTLGMPQY